MPNEREVRLGLLDHVEALRWLRTAAIRLEGAREALREAEEVAGGLRRRYPLPEAREWERRIDKLQREIESVLS